MSIWSDAARDAYRKTHRFPNQPNVNGGSGPVIKKRELPLEAKIKLATKLLDKDLFVSARPTSGPKLG
ncbi:hypothetical protein [Corallococcus llansteffanensis]|uniref:Uncharacterized protein n=1 Tax=Corallococcus llansteffanensis TaxID=2316731 RepID=A0A3A8P538_9BACT|nr:hypothetical protein [Corallococcus llansteffanensis]RKH50979.1 hypothetical protein D7V93_29840 [Corallococcus llansteffanensis]